MTITHVTVGRIIGFAILAIGVLLCIVGIATIEWMSSSPQDSPQYIFYGLFKTCGADKCVTYADFNDHPFTSSPIYEAAIGCLLTGLLMSGLSMICNFVIMLASLREGPHDHLATATVALLLAIFGALFMLSGTIIFVARVVLYTSTPEDYDELDRPEFVFRFHYSFILTIIGFVLVFAGGITTYATTRRTQALAAQVLSPGQTNIVVQNQNSMQNAAFSGQPQQQSPPAAAAQQPYQWPNQQYAAPQSKDQRHGEGWD